jgi:hypothetical protein
LRKILEKKVKKWIKMDGETKSKKTFKQEQEKNKRTNKNGGAKGKK